MIFFYKQYTKRTIHFYIIITTINFIFIKSHNICTFIKKLTTMKKLLIISIFMTSLFSYSQDLTVNDIPISELDAQYIRVNAEVKLLRPFRASVFLDWGQISRIKEVSKGWVLDENGKKFAFNGIMGAVNLLIENGYTIDHVYYNGNSESVNYIMKKID